LRNKGTHAARVLTADGEIELRRRYFWAAGAGGLCPADAAAGIEQGRVSPGARQILCRLGMVEDFAHAAEDAKRIGNVPVCRERLRQIVEASAQSITEARNASKLPAAWSSADAAVEGGQGRAGAGPTRLYVGVDGVMVPTVMQQEKDKRRQAQAVRRQQRSATGVGNARPLPAARKGSDERFKEMKIGLFYDQSKEHRHVFVTEANHEVSGKLLKVHAQQVAFERADESISLTDGAKWIASQICLALLTLQVMLLDFYHLSQHVYETAKCCLGDTPEARQWAAQRLKEIKEVGVTPLLAAIDALEKKARSVAKRRSLRLLRDYVVQRMEMVDYRTALAKGWDIGSGPTEAMCKNLTLRLKRTGMKWDRDHAAAMMNLTALYESGQAKAYWATAA
jgi:Uncharacterised protein family (UPF0236)